MCLNHLPKTYTSIPGNINFTTHISTCHNFQK
uniref:Uncharacterized protein n=1 Tax=Arundo donax TaxID=35708 RepID=A0A0A8ZGI9_ARUDO